MRVAGVFRSHFGLALLLLLVAGCGSSGSGTASLGSSTPAMTYEGRVVDGSGSPVADAAVTLYETAEGSVTGDNGRFLIESGRAADSATFFFELTGFSNLVEVAAIPPTSDLVSIEFTYDRSAGSVQVKQIAFATRPDNYSPPSDDPIEEDTPVPNVPGVNPTPKPALFDADGNTTAFGIPAGLTGNISRGKSVWNGACRSCHGAEKTNRSYGTIKNSFKLPVMASVHISKQQTADVTAYLNRGKK